MDSHKFDAKHVWQVAVLLQIRISRYEQRDNLSVDFFHDLRNIIQLPSPPFIIAFDDPDHNEAERWVFAICKDGTIVTSFDRARNILMHSARILRELKNPGEPHYDKATNHFCAGLKREIKQLTSEFLKLNRLRHQAEEYVRPLLLAHEYLNL